MPNLAAAPAGPQCRGPKFWRTLFPAPLIWDVSDPLEKRPFTTTVIIPNLVALTKTVRSENFDTSHSLKVIGTGTNRSV